MLLASWNINGLRSVINKGALVEFVAAVQPDILCLQEVKIQPAQVVNVNINTASGGLPGVPAEKPKVKSGQVALDIPGYHLVLNSAKRPGYSGTGLLIKRSLAIDESRVVRNLPADLVGQYDLADDYGDPNSEGRVISIDLGEAYLVTVYTPNAKPDLSRLKLRENKWDPAFRAYLSQLRQSKPVIFCGDLNVAAEEIDLANPKSNRGKAGFTDEERAGWHNYTADGFLDSFRTIHGDVPEQYTWWSHWAHSRERNVGWRIDYFMVDQALKSQLSDAQIYQSQMGSDHCPISVTMNI